MQPTHNTHVYKLRSLCGMRLSPFEVWVEFFEGWLVSVVVRSSRVRCVTRNKRLFYAHRTYYYPLLPLICIFFSAFSLSGNGLCVGFFFVRVRENVRKELWECACNS